MKTRAHNVIALTVSGLLAASAALADSSVDLKGKIQSVSHATGKVVVDGKALYLSRAELAGPSSAVRSDQISGTTAAASGISDAAVQAEAASISGIIGEHSAGIIGEHLAGIIGEHSAGIIGEHLAGIIGEHSAGIIGEGAY